MWGISVEKLKTRRGIVGGVALIVVLLIAIVFIGGRGSRGDGVLAEAVENIATAESMHAKATLQINLPEWMRNKKRPLTKVNAEVKGDIKRFEGNKMEMTGGLDLEARGPGNTFFTKGELRILDDETMFRLSEFPILLNPSGSLSNKWTSVRGGLLGSGNEQQVQSAFKGLEKDLVYQGVVSDEKDEALLHFTGMLSEEVEQAIQEAWQLSESNNRALDVVARLLMANNVDNIDVWVSKKGKELRRVKVSFVRPLKDGGEFDFAQLDVELSDYGREVAVNRPEEEMTVKPEVFAKLFGSGEVTEVKVEDTGFEK